MLRMRVDFASESLGMSTSAVVLIPQETRGQIGMAGGVLREGDGSPRIPVLYLLHGLSDDCTAWERRTSIERYASERGIAVVMPEVRRSFYADEVLGEDYWTFVSEELPALVAGTFRVSTRRADTFVAGLSMGGFGAMKLALHYPDRFAAAGSFSGVLDLRGRDFSGHSVTLPARVWGRRIGAADDAAGVRERFAAAGVPPVALGQADPPARQGPTRSLRASEPSAPRGTHEPVLPPADDLLDLLRRADAAALPHLWIGCGTEDSLLDTNERFVEVARSKGVEPLVRLTPGDHTWGLWDQYVREFLEWIPLDREA